jgi:signal transduction histidine kinase/DNA-binding response OmpR family regulator
MEALVYVAEGLFLVLFLATLREFVRRRDPVSRDLALVFSPLALIFVAEAWTAVAGTMPVPVALVLVGLLLLQPYFLLHLVSLVRVVPKQALWLALVLAVGSVPAILLAQGLGGSGGSSGSTSSASPPSPITVAVVAAFVAIEAAAAIYLLLEGLRREGPVAIRMWLAALSTGVFGAALLTSTVASAVGTSPETTRAATSILALVAGIGYFLAFLMPGPVRRILQARTTVEYTRQLIARSSEPVGVIWNGFTQLAVGMQGGSAVMIAGTRPGAAAIVTATGLEADATDLSIAWDDLDSLVEAGALGWDVPIDRVGPIRRRLAGLTGAQVASVVPFDVPHSDATAVLVLLSSHRTLFHVSDFELLRALGAQTAIVAERRAVMAEQEALAKRLEATVEALRSASAAKSDFVASMSHEFRTPLSAILGFSELMGGEPRDGDRVSVPIEWVDHIHRGGQHLLSLVNDVLDLARVEAGRLDLHPEPIEVASAVTEAVNGLRPLADRKGIKIETQVSLLTVVADRGRFRQILYNLVSNAIKYTPDGGTIRVAAEQVGPEVRVSVADNGVGIDPRDHQAVFEEFRQVGDPADRQPGTGLGLAVTKRLAEAHDGRMELESAIGDGSTFTLVLPAPSAAEAGVADPLEPREAAAAVEAVHSAVSSGDVLVIEDDPSAVRLLREYLEAAGYRIRVAATGESGLASVAQQLPAAIILDVLLPGIDGWEVLRRLKADERTGDIPVIIVTVVEERGVGLALGAADYLVKPIHREALLSCLARYVTTGHGAGQQKRVLVVDDEAAALTLIRAALEPEGYAVVTAQGGRAALEWAQLGQSVDLVVCDLVMPEVDGFEVIAALKRESRTASVPIVVCTAHDLSLEQKALLNGQILGIVAKGQNARLGLLDWLSRSAPSLLH